MACETYSWLQARQILLRRVLLIADDESLDNERRLFATETLMHANSHLENRRPIPKVWESVGNSPDAVISAELENIAEQDPFRKTPLVNPDLAFDIRRVKSSG